jgi:hypothetical protein
VDPEEDPMNLFLESAPNVGIWLIVDEESATASSLWVRNSNTSENEYARYRLSWFDPDEEAQELDIYIEPNTIGAVVPLGGVVAIDMENEDMAAASQYATNFNFPVTAPTE